MRDDVRASPVGFARSARQRPAIGADTTTRSRSSPRSTSALVGRVGAAVDVAAPVDADRHEEPGDGARGGDRGAERRRRRRARTRCDGRRPGAPPTIHSCLDGHAEPPHSSSTRSPIERRVDRAGRQQPGEGDAGLRAERRQRPQQHRVGRARHPAGGRRPLEAVAGPHPRQRRAPSAESGAPVAAACRSAGDRPARSVVPAIEPADVPTMTSAVRASHPVDSARAASTPACHAPPATPPAPRTRPTRTPTNLRWRRADRLVQQSVRRAELRRRPRRRRQGGGDAAADAAAGKGLESPDDDPDGDLGLRRQGRRHGRLRGRRGHRQVDGATPRSSATTTLDDVGRPDGRQRPRRHRPTTTMTTRSTRSDVLDGARRRRRRRRRSRRRRQGRHRPRPVASPAQIRSVASTP